MGIPHARMHTHTHARTHTRTRVARTHTCTHAHTEVRLTSSAEQLLKGVWPRLQTSYSSTPKLHTSLALEYFL